MDRKNVLVISGKDQKLTGDIRHFLRKIGLRPVEPQNPFPGGVSDSHKALRAAINAACAILIVLTGDDEATLRQRWCFLGNYEKALLQQRCYIPDDDEEDELYLSPQPCLNVLFEAGVAIAMRPKKTILVKRGRVRLSRYFEGSRLVELGDPPERRYALIKMLHSVGCVVDLSSNEWIDVGDFSDPEG